MNLKHRIGASFAVIITAAFFIPTSEALSVSDSPAPVFYAGHYFWLTPAVVDSAGAKLTFRLHGARPAWLHFSSATGAISGKPARPGVWSHLWLSVSDGQHQAWTAILLKVEPAASSAPATADNLRPHEHP